MDENNMENQPQSGPVHQHVHIFGAEVNAGSTGDREKNKEEWRQRREEWKAARHARRDEWKAQRDEWKREHGYGHGGHLFGGLILLLGGVMALLYTMGLVSPGFWHAVEPLWPVLLIFWGASLMLGRHWAARIVLFVLTLVILLWIIAYGLVKTDSPLVSYLSPTVVRAIQNTQTNNQ